MIFSKDRATTTWAAMMLTVYLNEQLVDVKKPVKVIWNGQPAVEVEPVLRLSVMLQTLTEHYDEGMFYTFKAELKGKP